MNRGNGRVVDQISEFDFEQCRLEDAVLGAVLCEPVLVRELATKPLEIKPSDFHRPTERKAYRKVCELVESGKTNADIVSRAVLRELLGDEGHDAGWLAVLVSRSHIEQTKSHFGPELKRLSRLRELQRAGAKALQLTANPDQIVIDYIGETGGPKHSDIIKPVQFVDLGKKHSTLRPAVIDGLLRQGETCNIVAAPKVGKSFLAGNLAWCIATGRPFLGHNVSQGRVLIIDNELHPETLANRLDHIAGAMAISNDERDKLDVVSLRGRLAPITMLSMILDVEPGRYSLIVLDALYRTLPAGTSENDNAAMTAVYNELDALAAKWQASIVVVHHSSKGSQGDKGITDVGAGAGSISRAPDTHLVIRPHDDGEHCVLEAAIRSGKPVEPISIKFDWPTWYSTTAEPIVKKLTRRNTDEQAQQDQADCDHLLAIIPDRGIVQNSLVINSGFGTNRCMRLLGILTRKKLVTSKRKRQRGGKQKFVVWTKAFPNNLSESFPNNF